MSQPKYIYMFVCWICTYSFLNSQSFAYPTLTCFTHAIFHICMCRALSIVGSYAKCQGTLDTGAYFTQSLYYYYQIDAVKCQGNAKGMHF